MKYLKRLSKWRNSSGFTLTEVIVSTALLGILIVGILMFMTPIFNMSNDSKANQKADLAATTMELYLSKSLRSSLYVRVYTGATLDDINDSAGEIYNDLRMQTMKDHVKANKDSYELRCISIKYVEDTNPRNQSEGENPYKYMLYNETYSLEGNKLLTDKSELIFDACFYEDIYPEFAFSRQPVCFDENGKEIVDVDVDDYYEHNIKTILYPVLEMDINMYDNENMGDMDRVFRGKSYIEVNNVKSLQLNSEGKYMIFEPHAVSDGTTNKDIYIFYVARKAGTVMGNLGADKEETEEATE